MAIALRGTPIGGVNGAGNSVSVSMPSGVVNGDFLIAGITGFGDVGANPATPNTPSGWTKIGEAQTTGTGGNTNTGWFYRVASSEPASYTLSNTGGSTYIDADISAYSGVDTANPFNLTAVSNTGKTGTAASAALGTTTRDGCWQVAHLVAYDALSGGTPSGFTGDLGYDGVPNDTIICHLVITTAGATSTASTATGAGGDSWVVWTVALQPPAVAAGGRREIRPGPAFRRHFYKTWDHPRLAYAPTASTQNLQQSLSAGLSFTGSGPAKATGKGLTAGTLSFSGAQTRLTAKGLAAAALSFSGAQARSLAKGLSAALSFTGSGPARAIGHPLSASLSFSGSQLRATSAHLTAALSFTGSQTRSIVKSGFSAALSFSGAVTKALNKSGFSAGLSFSGGLASHNVLLKALSASLSFSGAQTRQIGKALSAGLSFTGSGPIRAVAKAMSASLSLTGSLPRSVAKGLTAAGLSFAGSIASSRVTQIALSAGLSFSGAVRRQTNKGLSASLGFTGGMARAIQKRLAAASLGFSGLLSSSAGVVQVLVATIFSRSLASVIRTRTMSAVIWARNMAIKLSSRG